MQRSLHYSSPLVLTANRCAQTINNLLVIAVGTQHYTLEAQLDVGLAGEDAIAAFFSKWYVVKRANRLQQALGIDFVFKNIQSGEEWTVELKTDAKAVRNAFVELVAEETIDEKGRPKIVKFGWAWTSSAQVLLYYVSQSDLIYVVPMQVLRAAVAKYARRYPVVAVENDSYWTQGLLVPLSEFRKLAKKVCQLPQQTPPVPVVQEPVQLELPFGGALP